MPGDKKEVGKELEEKIVSAKHTIKILTYNFSYKKIVKLVKEQNKKEVTTEIIFDKRALKDNRSTLNKLCDKKYIHCYIADKKQHTKAMIFDKESVMFGSANLTKQSFKDNYEILYFTDKKKTIEKFHTFFDNLKQQSKKI